MAAAPGDRLIRVGAVLCLIGMVERFQPGADFGKGVLPADRLPGSPVGVEQQLQRRAAGPVHREQLGDGVGGGGTVAEHQLHLGRHRHAGRGQGLAVGGQL